MNKPLVSIICVGYNQGAYLSQALKSVYSQTYKNLQVVAVDDGSADDSQIQLINWQKKESSLEVVLLAENGGYCKAFNKGLALANGDYIIDLAADDKLLPSRVEEGVNALWNSPAGVHYCDAAYIDEQSRIVGYHYLRDARGKLLRPVPQGDLYRELLRRYFICAPTMMIERQVLDFIGGYDENLFYEDFDFWIRSAREFQYCYSDQVLVLKRVLPDSMSKTQYTEHSSMLASTAKVCAKAYKLNRSAADHQALATRLRYELRQAVLSNNYQVAGEFLQLMRKINEASWEVAFWKWLITQKWNFAFLRPFMGKAR